jgi:Fe-S-cluster containining protein
MRDGVIRIGLKAVARWVKTFDVLMTRWWLRRRGQQRYRLTGSCLGCGRCCEAPSQAVSRLTWFVPSARRVFLWWQRVVNGFELVSADARFRIFTFRCTHYQPELKRCDSYASRPLMCRDYPQHLTFAALPELFPECSYVIQDKNAASFQAALKASGLSPDKVRELEEKLYLRGADSKE